MSNGIANKIYESMMRRIILGELLEREALTEQALAQNYKASRTPVREACIHLLKEGVLRSAGRRGYVVAEISLDDVRELFQLRLMLEPSAAQFATERNPGRDFFSTCSGLIERYRTIATGERTYETFLELGKAEYGFHYEIAKASGNMRLAKIMGELMNQFRRFHYTWFQKSIKLDVTANEHHEILEAIRLHDASAARKLMYEHVQNGVQRAFQLALGSLSSREGSSQELLINLAERKQPFV